MKSVIFWLSATFKCNTYMYPSSLSFTLSVTNITKNRSGTILLILRWEFFQHATFSSPWFHGLNKIVSWGFWRLHLVKKKKKTCAWSVQAIVVLYRKPSLRKRHLVIVVRASGSVEITKIDGKNEGGNRTTAELSLFFEFPLLRSTKYWLVGYLSIWQKSHFYATGKI